MKITYLVQYYPPHIGGLEKIAQKQAQSAVSAGHDVSVVTFALQNTRAGTQCEDGVVVHRVWGNHFFDTHFGIPFCFGGISLWRTIMREVRTTDVVHMHDVFYLPSLIGYVASWWYKKPIVLTQHVAMVTHDSALVILIEKMVYGTWGRLIFRSAKIIITYQTIVRNFLLTQGVQASRILEVHNGIDINQFSPVTHDERVERRQAFCLPTDRPLALFVGRLVSKKGYRELFDARDPAYDLVFVGPGEVPEEWRHTSGVHVMGERTQDELVQLYPAVDVLVAPSHGEMFTLVMQEALACGVPLIIADAPEYCAYNLDREYIVLCEPTASTLKQELVRVLSDRALRTRMQTYSRVIAERWFSWESNVQPTLAVYDAIGVQYKNVEKGGVLAYPRP